MRKVPRLYKGADTALLRASAHSDVALPDWPDSPIGSPGQAASWLAWLRRVWELDVVAEAVEQASPALAREVDALVLAGSPDVRRVRRTSLSVARYVLRMTGRATPAGLFAGVSSVSFGSGSVVRWGAEHRVVARADAPWLSSVIAELESCPELLARLPLMVNSASFVRGDRLVVAYPPRLGGDHGSVPAAEVSIRHTEAVRIVVEAARAPVRCDAVAGKLAAEFPSTPASAIGGLINGLVKQHVLISSLHAPSTVTDALGHVVRELEDAGGAEIAQAADLVNELRAIHEALSFDDEGLTLSVGRSTRRSVTERMTALAPLPRRSPLAVDLRVDCSLVLPQRVLREAETAASTLARLSAYPFGTPVWSAYFTRFFERYGVGSAVPLLDLVNPDVGLGFPAGYLGAEPERREPVSARHRRLLALAQTAALDGRREVVLDERLIGELTVGEQDAAQVPPDLELCFQLRAPSQVALDRGDFDLSVVSVSRAAGTMCGRFLGLLAPQDRERATAFFDELSHTDPETLPVQVSFPPLDLRDAHVTRAPEVLSAVISVGEHRAPGGSSIPLDDLAVVCDKRRLHLVSLSRGRRLSPTVLHALDLRAHTLPLVRFLVEVAKAQHTVVTGFDWGPAVDLPFLPRLRYGRVILSPARWRLERTELPGRASSWPDWRGALTEWRARRGLPSAVVLAEGDHRLHLDLGEPAHLELLRAHLDSADAAVLAEAPAASARGWFGGRPHEIVTAMRATQPAPAAPPVMASRMIGRDHGDLPGSSAWLHAKLYGHPERQPEIVARHLPELFTRWDELPRWWFTRFGDPESHLRLRIELSNEAGFGTVAQHLSTWADGLRRQGLLRDMQFATTYPETGRWGEGAAWDAAVEVFAADSRAVAAEFVAPGRPKSRALAAVHFVSIACDFTGSTSAGMTWLIEHAHPGSPKPVDRALLKEAVRLADPADGWAALTAVPGGPAIAAAWTPRRHALARYRARLTGADGINPDMVLDSLLHAHHLRAVGIDSDDERTCRRFARAAALSWRARTTREQGRP